MINRQRVRRIKNMIYAFIVLAFFMPAVLAVALLFKVIGLESDVKSALTTPETNTNITNQALNQNKDETFVLPANSKESAETSKKESSQQNSEQSSQPNETESSIPEQNNSTASSLPTQNSEEQKGSSTNSTSSRADNTNITSTNSSSTANNESPNTGTSSKNGTDSDFLLDVPNTGRGKIIYLAFNYMTPKQSRDVLSLLKNNNSSATFFVDGKGYDADFYREIINSGNSIGIENSTSLKSFSKQYNNSANYLGDFFKVYDKLNTKTGINANIYRLTNDDFNNPDVINSVKSNLEKHGFSELEFDAIIEDTESESYTLQSLIDSAKDGNKLMLQFKNNTTSQSTIKALEKFIIKCIDEGYAFVPIQ